MSDYQLNQFDVASVQAQQEEKQYKYTAFISYRHLKPDAEIAQKIHTIIETFKAPKEFKVDGKLPSFRVFRDREELTTSSLSDSLDEALRNSKFLIVICSKRLPLSEWCNKEVEQFIALNGVDRVIPVLIEGEPHESFPNILKGYQIENILDDGQVEVTTKEILAAELRPVEVLDPNFEGYEALEKNNPEKLEKLTKESIGLLKTEKYRIMAAILGVTYGDLKQRDKERRQRQLLISSAVASALLLFFGIFMFNAYQNENRAKIQTIQDKSRLMLDNAQELINDGDKVKAIILANKAMESIDPSMQDYPVLKNQHYSILNNTVDLDSSSVISVVDTHNRFTFIDSYHQKKQFVAGLNNDSVGVWDIETGSLIQSLEGHTQQVKLVEVASDDATFVSGGFDDLINIWDAQTFENLGQIKAPGNIMLLNYTHDLKQLHVIYDTLEMYTYQRYDLSTLEPVGPEIEMQRNINRVVFSPDDTQMLINFSVYKPDNSLILFDLNKGVISHNFADQEFLVKDLFTDEESMEKSPYENMKVVDDFKSLYTLTGGKVLKMDIETGKVLFVLEESSFYSNFDFEVTSDNHFVYYANGSKLMKANHKTGEKIHEILIDGSSIKEVVLSQDDSTIVTLGEEGEINVIHQDFLVQPNLDYKTGQAEYLYMSYDNNEVITLSLTDQNIKIISLFPENSSEVIEGQIVGQSPNNKYSLFLNNFEYVLFNNETMTQEKTFNHDYLYNDRIYLTDGTSYILSDDGTKLVGLVSEDIDEFSGIPQTHSVFALDLDSMEVLVKEEIDIREFYLNVSQDSKYLYFNTGPSEMMLIYLDQGTPDKTLKFDAGFVAGLNTTSDNKYYAVSYQEGISNIYSFDTQELVFTVPGELLLFESTKDGTEIVSVYNNIGSVYTNFEKVSDVTLSKQRDEFGTSLDETNVYSKQAQLLLTMKKSNDVTYAYLVDFESGQLLKRFEIYLDTYTPKGYFVPSGEGVVLDQVFGSTKTNFEDDIFLTKYTESNKFVVQSGYFTLMQYDDIVKRSKEFVKEVKLTPQQLEELGISE